MNVWFDGLETAIEELKRRTGRECGSCSMCCRLLEIKELNKPYNKWCAHCRPGNGGCGIYVDRPQICRGFACGWLINAMLADHWFPQRSKMILQAADVDEAGHAWLLICVDVNFPNRWREEPYFSEIRQMALEGLKATPQVFTRVSIGTRTFAILPHRQIEIESSDFVSVIQISPDHFECVVAKSKADTERIDKLFELMGRDRALRLLAEQEGAT